MKNNNNCIVACTLRDNYSIKEVEKILREYEVTGSRHYGNNAVDPNTGCNETVVYLDLSGDNESLVLGELFSHCNSIISTN